MNKIVVRTFAYFIIGMLLSLCNVKVIAQESGNFIKPIKPIEKQTSIQRHQVNLGKVLFEDVNLSENKQMACISCHLPEKGYADGLPFSKDNAGKDKVYNTPSISYSIYNYHVSWTGKFKSLEEHLDFLITNKTLMNRKWPSLIAQLKGNSEYQSLFTLAGYNEISKSTVIDAIIKFEANLAKPSRFDLYLLGDKTKLNSAEIAGFNLFKSAGCVSCHQGTNLGGNLRQKFGVIKPYFPEQKINTRDLGYFNSSGKDEDINFFRVPSLRNVAKTAPYFHDASAPTLEKAIQVMFTYQLGIDASEEDIESIKAFLATLDAIE